MISRRERRVSQSEYVFRFSAILSVLCVSYVPRNVPENRRATAGVIQVPSSIYLSPMEKSFRLFQISCLLMPICII